MRRAISRTEDMGRSNCHDSVTVTAIVTRLFCLARLNYPVMRKTLWTVIALICALSPCAMKVNAQSIPTASGQQWQSTWAREFNSGASGLTGFTYDVGGGGWGNQEK